MKTFEQLLKDRLKDPKFRENWERTALARAVAIEVVKYRSQHGLSQSALARRLGVSHAVVWRLELGEHEPKIATLRKLSQVLGLRFIIDIHPESLADNGTGHDDETVERVTSNGVELVVRAG